MPTPLPTRSASLSRGFMTWVLAALLGILALPAVATAAPVNPTIDALHITPPAGSAPLTLDLTWKHTGDSLQSYEITYREKGTTAWQWSSTTDVGEDYRSWVPVTDGRTTYTRSLRGGGLQMGKTYEVTVRAIPTAGCPCSDQEASKLQFTATAPTGLAMTQNGSAANLQWGVTTTSPTFSGYRFDAWTSGLPGGYRLFDTTTSSATSRTLVGASSKSDFPGFAINKFHVVQVTMNQGSKVTSEAAVAESFTAPAQCTDTTKRYCVVYPNAFVDRSTGLPATLSGVNVKRAVNPRDGGLDDDDPTTVGWGGSASAQIVALGNRSAPGAPNFNVVRLALDWPRFQTGPTTWNEANFTRLKRLVATAKKANVSVILDPLHLSAADGEVCTDAPGSSWDIPSWAWKSTTGAPTTDSTGDCGMDGPRKPYISKVLAQGFTAAYLQRIVREYKGDPTVVGIDLVNEPFGKDGATVSTLLKELVPTYRAWLGTTDPRSIRKEDTQQLFIVNAIGSSASLAQDTDLSGLGSNVVLSLHDYITGSVGTNATWGNGYGNTGYSSQHEVGTGFAKDSANALRFPYDPALQSYATRKSQHKGMVQQYVDWASKWQLPVYIGEYGTLNPCKQPVASKLQTSYQAAWNAYAPLAAQYATDTAAVYNSEITAPFSGQRVQTPLSRTWWALGDYNPMSLTWTESGSCGPVARGGWFPWASTLGVN